MKSYRKAMISFGCALTILIVLSSIAYAVPSDYCQLAVGDEFEYSFAVYDDGVLTESVPFNATIDTLTNTTSGSVESTQIDYTIDNGTDLEYFSRTINSTDTGIGWTYSSVFGAPYEILFISSAIAPTSDFEEMQLLSQNWNITANYTAEGVLFHYKLDNPDFNGQHHEIICDLVSSNMANNNTTPGSAPNPNPNNTNDIPGYSTVSVIGITMFTVYIAVRSKKKKVKFSK